MYLSTILDDNSRYIATWKLFSTMTARDITDALDVVLQSCTINSGRKFKKPRLLSDNDSSYVASELAGRQKKMVWIMCGVHRCILKRKVRLNVGTRRLKTEFALNIIIFQTI